MNTFWLKITGIAVVVLGLIIAVKTLSPKVEEALDFEKMYEETEELVEAQEAKLQAELAEAEAKAKQAKAKHGETEQPSVQPRPPRPESDEIEELQQDIQAQKLYQMAETEFKIARRPLMSFKRCVDYCRELIERYPDSPEAAKARVLLRRIPERHRKRYNITDEEMGL
jgi:hypothetical protein